MKWLLSKNPATTVQDEDSATSTTPYSIVRKSSKYVLTVLVAGGAMGGAATRPHTR